MWRSSDLGLFISRQCGRWTYIYLATRPSKVSIPRCGHTHKRKLLASMILERVEGSKPGADALMVAVRGTVETKTTSRRRKVEVLQSS